MFSQEICVGPSASILPGDVPPPSNNANLYRHDSTTRFLNKQMVCKEIMVDFTYCLEQKNNPDFLFSKITRD